MVVAFLLMETKKKIYETDFLAFYLRHVCLENRKGSVKL